MNLNYGIGNISGGASSLKGHANGIGSGATSIQGNDSEDAFAEALMRAESSVIEPHQAASQAVEQFVHGADGGIHETMIALDRAEISFKYMTSVRNKMVEAYREVMRMGA